MATDSVFHFKSYKEYLALRTGAKGSRQGVKTEMARAMGCQPTYITQVVYQGAHLSLEQAEAVSTLWNFDDSEKKYFMLLVQFDRAGTPSLRKYFEKEIELLRHHALDLTRQLGRKGELTERDKSEYYAHWLNAAVHMALLNKNLQSASHIATYFRVSEVEVQRVIQLLRKLKIIRIDRTGIQVQDSALRLGNDSPLLLRHHLNWRQQAVLSLPSTDGSNWHYTSVVSASREAALKMKQEFLNAMKANIKHIEKAKDEHVYGICLDFWQA